MAQIALRQTLATGSRIITQEHRAAGTEHFSRELDVAANDSDSIRISIEQVRLELFCLATDQEVTFQFQSEQGETPSFTLYPGIPLVWVEGSVGEGVIPPGVSELVITNEGDQPAHIDLEILHE